METPKFILVHLQSNNNTVVVNVKNIHLVIKDYPASDSKTKTKQGPYTCIYFNNPEPISRIFVNESVERVYNMLNPSVTASSENNGDVPQPGL